MNSRLWLLPEGVEELMPAQARQVEKLRRQLLDLYACWGYQQVVPPLCEVLDALLTGTGSDLDLQTFKITDQKSGRLLGIRPDMTPQVARIDARSHAPGQVQRLSYIGTVLRARAPHFEASRSPIQTGCELFGEPGIHADEEIASLMVQALRDCGLRNMHLDLAHMGIVRRILECSGLEPAHRSLLIDAWRRRAVPEVEAIAGNVADPTVRDWIICLPEAIGEVADVRKLVGSMGSDPVLQSCLDELQRVSATLSGRFPDVSPCVDLCEMRGYNYHTGLIFAVYMPGSGNAVAAGGRYDGVGREFSQDPGAARPATGFSIDLRAVLNTLPCADQDGPGRKGIWLADDADASAWPFVQALRARGECVIQAMPASPSRSDCDRELVRVLRNGEVSWDIKPIE